MQYLILNQHTSQILILKLICLLENWLNLLKLQVQFISSGLELYLYPNNIRFLSQWPSYAAYLRSVGLEFVCEVNSTHSIANNTFPPDFVNRECNIIRR